VCAFGPLACRNSGSHTSSSDGEPPAAPNQALENEQALLPESPLTAGEQVFDFQALAHTGQRVKLSAFLDKPVVVYFCPQDTAELCTDLASGLRDAWLELNAHVSMAFAVSPEPTPIHREFAIEHELPHLFLADTSGKVREIFGLKPGVAIGYLVGEQRQILRVLQPASGAAFIADLQKALAELGLLRAPYPI
jgi:peroxiredoxin Q/BCP